MSDPVRWLLPRQNEKNSNSAPKNKKYNALQETIRFKCFSACKKSFSAVARHSSCQSNQSCTEKLFNRLENRAKRMICAAAVAIRSTPQIIRRIFHSVPPPLGNASPKAQMVNTLAQETAADRIFRRSGDDFSSFVMRPTSFSVLIIAADRFETFRCKYNSKFS